MVKMKFFFQKWNLRYRHAHGGGAKTPRFGGVVKTENAGQPIEKFMGMARQGIYPFPVEFAFSENPLLFASSARGFLLNACARLGGGRGAVFFRVELIARGNRIGCLAILAFKRPALARKMQRPVQDGH